MNPEEPVRLGAEVDLSRYPTKAPEGLKREEAEGRLEAAGRELDELEELLFAARDTGLLILFQGRDTSGKDGAIRTLLRYMNVQSCRVQGFKVPTEEERAHDFLWRVHPQLPPHGGVAIFNRSHYEDVLVVRVHDLAPRKVWEARYAHINAFEQLAADSGTIILKFFLHISKKEQEERLLAREKDPVKSWKLSVGDWKERERWGDYTKAFEDALSKCSTDHAPWYIVPADNKWYRDLFITERVVAALQPYQKQWMEGLARVGEAARTELTEYRTAKQER